MQFTKKKKTLYLGFCIIIGIIKSFSVAFFIHIFLNVCIFTKQDHVLFSVFLLIPVLSNRF